MSYSVRFLHRLYYTVLFIEQIKIMMMMMKELMMTRKHGM